MIEKTLHGVNIGASCAQLVTQAVDISSSGGLVTGTGAVLSGLAILKGKQKEQKELSAACLDALQGYLDGAGLHANVEKQVVLVLDSYLPAPADFASGNLNAGSVAHVMRKRVEDESKVEEFQDEKVLKAYEALLAATLKPILTPRTQSEANDAEILTRTDEIIGLLKANQALAPLLAAGITEKAIIGLAQKISTETVDVNQAWIELQDGIARLERLRADGLAESNLDDSMKSLSRRIAELVSEGENRRAGDEIDAALSREEEESQARKGKLLDRGVEVALLDRDTKRAAELLVRKADLEAGGSANFEGLRSLQQLYCIRGRDNGVSLDLEVAIDLAKLLQDQATTSKERWAANFEFAVALHSLGTREKSSKRLLEAIELHRTALNEITRNAAPLDWGMAQDGLGTALAILGERES